MAADPDLVVCCPHCGSVMRIFQITTGSMYGAISWTDGFRDYPMMPRPPRITRCHACTKLFWTAEAPQIGYYFGADAPNQNAEWGEAPYVQPLEEAAMLEAIREGLGFTPELELELRVATWWRGNDAFRRDDAPVGHATDPEAIANMERFIEMMHDGEEDLLLFRAEAQRHLGRFDEMKTSLEGVACSDYWPAKSKLLELAAAGDRRLHKLFA